MHALYRRIYRLLLRLHPAAFRSEFTRDMALDFEEAVYTFGGARLLLDAASSVARQWSACVSFRVADPASVAPPSLLAGNYVMIRDRSFTPLELGRGMVASMLQIALCLLALSALPGHTPGIPAIYALSSTPVMDRNRSQ